MLAFITNVEDTRTYNIISGFMHAGLKVTSKYSFYQLSQQNTPGSGAYLLCIAFMLFIAIPSLYYEYFDHAKSI